MVPLTSLSVRPIRFIKVRGPESPRWAPTQFLSFISMLWCMFLPRLIRAPSLMPTRTQPLIWVCPMLHRATSVLPTHFPASPFSLWKLSTYRLLQVARPPLTLLRTSACSALLCPSTLQVPSPSLLPLTAISLFSAIALEHRLFNLVRFPAEKSTLVTAVLLHKRRRRFRSPRSRIYSLATMLRAIS